MTLAKALANGLPMGAMLATEEVAAAFSPGTHATTFGGTPLVSAAGAGGHAGTCSDGDVLEQLPTNGRAASKPDSEASRTDRHDVSMFAAWG